MTFTSIEEIKQAVRDGKAVRWSNDSYIVHQDTLGRFLVTFEHNDHTIGLTSVDGTKLNGALEQFYITEPA